MLFYFLILFAVALIGIYENKKNVIYIYRTKRYKGNRAIVLLSLLLLLFFISILRDLSVGGDLPNYIRSFNNWGSLSIEELKQVKNTDVLFLYLNWFAHKVTSDFRIMIVFVTLFCLPLYLLTFYKYSKSIWLSVYLFIVWGGLGYLFSGLRACLAMSVVFYSVNYVQQKKCIKFIILMLIATLLHRTAIICFPMYIIGQLKLNRVSFILYALTACIFTLISFLGIEGTVGLYSINNYSDYVIKGEGYGMLLLLITLSVFILLFKNKIILSSNVNNILINYLIMACILQILALNFSLLTRFTSFYSYFITLLIPNTISSFKRCNTRYILTALTLVMGACYFYFITRNNTAGLMPYKIF